jgi:hypothetical protein
MESEGSKSNGAQATDEKQSEETLPSGDAIQSLKDASSRKVLLIENRKDS